MDQYHDYMPYRSPILGVINCIAIELFIGLVVWFGWMVCKGAL